MKNNIISQPPNHFSYFSSCLFRATQVLPSLVLMKGIPPSAPVLCTMTAPGQSSCSVLYSVHSSNVLEVQMFPNFQDQSYSSLHLPSSKKKKNHCDLISLCGPGLREPPSKHLQPPKGWKGLPFPLLPAVVSLLSHQKLSLSWPSYKLNTAIPCPNSPFLSGWWFCEFINLFPHFLGIRFCLLLCYTFTFLQISLPVFKSILVFTRTQLLPNCKSTLLPSFFLLKFDGRDRNIITQSAPFLLHPKKRLGVWFRTRMFT